MEYRELWAGERLLGVWVAGVTFGPRSGVRTGGSFLLTDRRLVFRPVRIFGESLSLAEEAGDLGQLLGTLGNIIQVGNAVISRDAHFMALDDVTAVRSIGRARLHLDMAGGGTRYYTVSAKRSSPIWSGKNAVVRDDLARQVEAAAAALRGAS